MFVATSSEIDLTFCGIALRAVTDELARYARRPGADDTVRGILPGLFEIAARGRAMLADILDARYADVSWGGDEMEPGLPLNTIEGRRWIYDPIDGAYHYIQGLPLWSASLALVENGEVVLALVYDPATNEMFAARRPNHVERTDDRRLRQACIGERRRRDGPTDIWARRPVSPRYCRRATRRGVRQGVCRPADGVGLVAIGLCRCRSAGCPLGDRL